MEKVPESARILNEQLPAEVIRRLAKECGAVRRVLKVDIVILVWTVVLAPKEAAKVTLASMQNLFEFMSEVTIVSSAFQRRFNAEFAHLIRACIEYLLEQLCGSSAGPISALFREFSDVLAIDSSLVNLPDCLASVFPGPRNNSAPAAMKVNAVYSVVRSTMKSVAIAKGTKAEIKFLKITKDMAGHLLLFDLGYYSSYLFHKIDKVGAFFVSRLKANANPQIVKDLTSGSGRRRNLVGMRIKDAVKNLGRGELDVIVVVHPKRPKSKKKISAKKPPRRVIKPLELRVVGVRHPETGEFHLYITNVPKSSMNPEQIRVAYSARWFVELVFKELKSDCGMDKVTSKKKCTVEALVGATIIHLLLSRSVMEGLIARMTLAAEQSGGKNMKRAVEASLRNRITTRRAVKALGAFGPTLLPHVILLATGRNASEHLDACFLAAMIDPNVTRDRLDSRVRNAKREPIFDSVYAECG